MRFSPTRLNYLLAYVVLGLVIGFAMGLIGSFLQASRMIVFGPWGVLILPCGLVLAIVLLLVLVRGGAWLASSRRGAGRSGS